MASLLDNLHIALQEMKKRLDIIEQHGPSGIQIIYPHVHFDTHQVYYDLKNSLPSEIERLEWRIKELKMKDGSNTVDV